MTGHEGEPGFLHGQALEGFADNGGEVEDEVRPKDDMQDDAGAVHWIEGSQVEEEDRGFGEEDGGIVYDLDDVIELKHVNSLLTINLCNKR